MKFTLRQLEYFRAIAQTETIKEAANRLHVSPSTLTASLNELERAAGVKLLERRKATGTTLTEDGKQFLDGAIVVLHAAEELEGSVSERAVTGTLNVGCYLSLMPTIAPAVISAVESVYPELHVEFVGETQEQMLSKLRAGTIELAMLYHFENWQDIATTPLFSAIAHIDVAPTHPLAQHDVIDVHQLHSEPMIHLDSPPAAEATLSYLRSHGVLPTIARRSNSFEQVRSHVARGEGFALLIQEPKSRLSYEGLPLVRRPIRPRPPEERFVVASIKSRLLSARGRAFLRVVKRLGPSIAPAMMYDLGADE